MCETRKPIFPAINADELEVTEVESLCPNCYKTGITRLLLTKIPHYKDVVVVSFSCDECGHQNNELQSGAPIAEKAVRWTLRVTKPEDLNRQVVKSDYAAVKIPEVDLEIPRKGQKGEVTTVEGVLSRVVTGLEQDQESRETDHPELFRQIHEFVRKLRKLKDVSEPFTLILEDISGNSHVENPYAPQTDPNCTVERFKRTEAEDHDLGIYAKAEIDDDGLKPEDLHGEVMQFPTNCNVCDAICTTNMKLTDVPHFREVVIMATVCDSCGNRTNEVKSGGGVEPQGIKIEVRIERPDDFSRDVLKSDTCSLAIPELRLEVGPHALGGRFTTVEGLVTAIREQLGESGSSHVFGDSVDPSTKANFERVIGRLGDVLDGKVTATVVLDDPAGNSYVQKLAEVDDRLSVERYERSFEQNEELGLNDIVTEDYKEIRK